jgi:hypothetical protein
MIRKSHLVFGSLFLVLAFFLLANQTTIIRIIDPSLLLGDALPPSVSVIDISKDLTALGIASTNIPANDPNIDSAPLLKATIEYASSHNIPRVIIPHGTYYFNSTKKQFNEVAHLYLENIKNVTLEGNSSTFIFSARNGSGILVKNSNGVHLQDLVLDYSDVPFTTAIVGSVDAAKNTITLASIEGRPVTDFNIANGNRIFIFVFRKVGGILTNINIGRLRTFALDNNKIAVTEASNITKQLVPDLLKIQPGDILSITERDYTAYNALAFTTYPPNISSNNSAKNITIYSSPAVAASSMWQKNFSFENITVAPNPNRTQYISSNADGINITNNTGGASITNSHTTLTGDDGISAATSQYGTVLSANSSTTLTIAERYLLHPGQTITITDPNDLHEYGRALVKELQLIPVPVGQPKQALITLDGAGIPNIQPGAFIFTTDTITSPQLIIQNNTVKQSLSRGIYLSGVDGATINSNTILGTSSSGILLQQLIEAGEAYKTPPTNDVTVENNTVEDAFGWGVGYATGAIESSVYNHGAHAVSNNSHITLSNNTITVNTENSKHVGIYFSNTAQCDATNNSVHTKKSDTILTLLNSIESVVFGSQVTECSREKVISPNIPSSPSVDQTPPSITLLGSSTYSLTVGTPWSDPGATATDTVDGNLTSHIKTSGKVDTEIADDYKILYTVSDSAGNITNVTRSISVYKPQTVIGGGGSISSPSSVSVTTNQSPQTPVSHVIEFHVEQIIPPTPVNKKPTPKPSSKPTPPPSQSEPSLITPPPVASEPIISISYTLNDKLLHTTTTFPDTWTFDTTTLPDNAYVLKTTYYYQDNTTDTSLTIFTIKNGRTLIESIGNWIHGVWNTVLGWF